MRATLPVLEAAFEGLPVAVLHTDVDRTILAVNAAAERLLGWPREELVGRSTDMLYTAREGFSATGAHLDPERAVDAMQFEVELRRRDGSDFHAAVHARILRDEGGTPTGFVGTILDVTEARRWNARRELLARMTELSVSLDPAVRIAAAAKVAQPELADGTIIYLLEPDGAVSLAAVEHVDPAQVPIIRASFAAGGLPPDAPHGYRRVLREGVTEFIPRVGDDLLARSSRGPEHRAILQASGIRSMITVPLTVDGPPMGALMVWRTRVEPFVQEDVLLAEDLGRRVAIALEHARLYRSEREARAAAEEAARAKDEFLAVVSHELRTPLNAILGWARLLGGGGLDAAKATRAVATIERNAVAQAKLVEDLIDVSRIIAGKLELATGAVDVTAVAHGVVDALRPSADAGRIALAMDVERPGQVRGDAERIRQVLMNVASNAIKFSDAGGRVRVVVGGDDATVEVAVTDTGPGIAPAFLPHVFDRFTQGDTGPTRRHGGLGIGLAVARHLVELHHGTIRAESEGLGRGARFVVRLPRDDDADAPGSAPASRRGSGALLGVRVLVVDDHPDARDLARWILEDHGAAVVLASDAAQAMAALAAGGIDVLVCDVAMPGEDGQAMVRRLRRLPPDQGGATPAVAVTAYASADDRARSIGAGFDAHLAKPIDADELAHVVGRLARARSRP